MDCCDLVRRPELARADRLLFGDRDGPGRGCLGSSSLTSLRGRRQHCRQRGRHLTATGTCAGHDLRPDPVPGATWQAGVTPGSEGLRVLFEGEPVPSAFAARAGPAGGRTPGWVDCLAEPVLTAGLCPSPRAPLGAAYRIPRHDEPRRLYGRVEVVAGD